MIFKALMKPHQNVSCLISKEIPSYSLTKSMYSTIHPSKSTLVLIYLQSFFQQYTTIIIKSLSPKMMFLVKMDPSLLYIKILSESIRTGLDIVSIVVAGQ